MLQMNNIDFIHVIFSRHYAQSNGQALNAVQEAKGICRQEDPLLAPMIYRAMPFLEVDTFQPSVSPGARWGVDIDLLSVQSVKTRHFTNGPLLLFLYCC